MVKRYSLHKIDGNQYQLAKDGTSQVGVIYNDKDVAEWTVDLLNELENTRLRQKKEIAKYKDKESLYQRLIGGMKAYVELECNNDLWFD